MRQVLVHSKNMGASTFAGPGAGRFPTANSVMNDLLRLSQDKAPPSPFPLNDEALVLNNDYLACFYVRIKCSDSLGIIRCVRDIEKHFCACAAP